MTAGTRLPSEAWARSDRTRGEPEQALEVSHSELLEAHPAAVLARVPGAPEAPSPPLETAA
eukprot:1918758-Pyramimonas_sp.AAC.1